MRPSLYRTQQGCSTDTTFPQNGAFVTERRAGWKMQGMVRGGTWRQKGFENLLCYLNVFHGAKSFFGTNLYHPKIINAQLKKKLFFFNFLWP